MNVCKRVGERTHPYSRSDLIGEKEIQVGLTVCDIAQPKTYFAQMHEKQESKLRRLAVRGGGEIP